MKKLNLKLGGIKEILSREQMKKITGGYDNPNCEGTSGTYDWYCCDTSPGTFLGNMTCDEASHQCTSLITNDPSRC